MRRGISLIVLSCLLLAGMAVSLAAPSTIAATVKCGGQPATIIGSAGAEMLRGTAGDDVIDGRGGDDVIIGLGGDDVLCGGMGADRLYGGDGDDRLFGGPGDDLLSGDAGADKLKGQGKSDILHGGSDDDVLRGGSGSDVLVGTPGTDSDNGGSGTDYCHGEDNTRRGCERKAACVPDYAPPQTILSWVPDYDFSRMSAADISGDGWPDLLISRQALPPDSVATIDVLLNDGSGNLAPGNDRLFTGPVPTVRNAREILFADFNGDGRLDIFFGDEGYDSPPNAGFQNHLVLSTAGGRMADASDLLPQQADTTHSATAADIDGDGDMDLYVGNVFGEGGENPGIQLNTNGRGRFELAPGRLPHPLEDKDFGAYTTAEFVDVDGDAIPDLILGDFGDDLEGGYDSPVLINDGSGHFTRLAGAIPTSALGETAIALDITALDLNGDGFQDLLIDYSTQDFIGRHVQVLINDGDGTFRDETRTRLPQSDNHDPWIVTIDLFDLDKDGYFDIFARPVSAAPVYYVNTGRGTFRPQTDPFDIGYHQGEYLLVAYADFNRDGYVDAVWSEAHYFVPGGRPESHFLVEALPGSCAW